jgi:two-component sensor histidine kinase
MSFATPAVLRAEPLILVEEITHRVLNEYTEAIASIALASAGIADAEARAVLTSAARRLHEHAQAHRALQAPATSDFADLGDYLGGVCAALTCAQLRERGVRLTLILSEVRLAAGRCWRVGLIVAELINNAVRHGLRGGGGDIVVEVRIRDDEVHCRVSDDGGPTQDIAAGRGRRVAQGLAAELGGQVTWAFADSGATALLSFPVQSHPASPGL